MKETPEKTEPPPKGRCAPTLTRAPTFRTQPGQGPATVICPEPGEVQTRDVTRIEAPAPNDNADPVTGEIEPVRFVTDKRSGHAAGGGGPLTRVAGLERLSRHEYYRSRPREAIGGPRPTTATDRPRDPQTDHPGI